MREIDKVIDNLRSGTPADELEHNRLEFKQEDASLKRTLEILADAVVCFANADGGTVVIGVRDRPAMGDGSIVGVGPSLTRDVLLKGIFDRTQPSLSVPVEQLVVDGRHLLVVTVPRGATFYSNARGTATRRLGTECVPFPPDQQRQALAARGLHDWSAQPSGRGISDVDPSEMRRLRRLLTASGKDDLARAADDRLLRDLRLCDPDGGLYRAGLLLVGEEDVIRSAIPAYGYSYQYRRSPGGEATSRFRGHAPLLSGLDQLLNAVETRRSVQPINVAGGVQLQVYDYPTNAVRELVVNALVHRDYDTDGAVSVEQSPESLSVSSPGGLVFGITPDNILTHPSTPRNRLLLEAVTALQVAERTGQGVDRVYRELLRVGKPPPDYTDTTTAVRVVVEGGSGNDAFVRYVTNDLDPDLSADVDVLLTLAHLRERRSITAQTLAGHVQRSVPEAQIVLDRMAQHDLVEPTRRTARKPFPSFGLRPRVLTALGRAVRYHQRKPVTGEQKVVEHVREYGHVTNQTLRRIFDLDVYAARDLLRDLQQRDILVKLDGTARGPGVRYGPGSAFPPRPRSRRTGQ